MGRLEFSSVLGFLGACKETIWDCRRAPHHRLIRFSVFFSRRFAVMGCSCSSSMMVGTHPVVSFWDRFFLWHFLDVDVRDCQLRMEDFVGGGEGWGIVLWGEEGWYGGFSDI